MKHVIIGGHGFVGSQLTKMLLDDGQECLVVDIGEAHDQETLGNSVNHLRIDVSDEVDVQKIPIGKDDVVYNLAARQYHDAVPRRNRQEWFNELNVTGTENLLKRMVQVDCNQFVFFSTDMVYGIPKSVPVKSTHSLNPIGEYGESKRRAEIICEKFRKEGVKITILRPRLILGRGRLGVLQKLFAIIRRGLPVPLIGDGRNVYQMVSVVDCAKAALKCAEADFPNRAFNLGSANPPKVFDLLQRLIDDVGSRSVLIRTPASLVKSILTMAGKLGIDIMHKEQYLLADSEFIVDITETKNELNWQPELSDYEMLREAYDYYLHVSGKL